MISITFIGSGSKGNCALLQFSDSLFLFDAGLSCKRITDFLNSKNLTLSDLSGIFLTHEHDDHIRGLNVLLKKIKLPVYCTAGTLEAIKSKINTPFESHLIKRGQEFEINYETRVFPFKVPHDAAEPCGIRFENNQKVMTIASDMGHVTKEVAQYCCDADILCVESNYDGGMLRSCKYPGWLKKRIKSPIGHLPNEGVRGILSQMKKVPEALVLMHISQESNTHIMALESLETFFENTGSRFNKMRLSLTFQNETGETISTSQPKMSDRLAVY